MDFPPPDFLTKMEHHDAAATVIDSAQYHHEDTNYPTLVTGITDGRGVRTWNFAYDSGGRATSSARAGDVDGNTVAYSAYNTNPPTRTVTNSLGRQSIYRYNSTSATRLVGVDGVASTNCPSDSSSISYSSAGFISLLTDQEGRVTNYTRDTRGRPTQITEAAGTADQRVTTVTWHASFDLPLTITRPGLTTTYTYNATGALTQKTQTDTTTQTVPYSTNGQTRTWMYTYTSGGLLDTVDGPLAGPVDTIDYDYDSSGYLSQITDQMGHVTTIVSVNGRGQPTEVLDANAVTTAFEYDDLGRVTAITRNPGISQEVTDVDYDGAGDITKIIRPDGSYLEYEYDDAQRVTTITNNLGEEIDYNYNLKSEPVQVDVKSTTGSIELTRSALYDEIGRLMATIGAGSQETHFAHDKVDNQTSVTDPRNNVWGYAFDRLDRLESETTPDTGVTQYTRSAYDDVTQVQDATGLSTTYVRNGFGDVIRQTSPDTGITDYVVNALGLTTSTTDARGVGTEYTYDDLGRVLTKTFPAAAAENVTYGYDDTTGGNYGVGRLTSISNNSGTTAYTYDALGRVVAVEQTIAGDAFTTGYQYDVMDRVVSVTYPSGRVVIFQRDAAGRITGISTQDSSLSTPEAVLSDATYLPFYPSEVFGGGAPTPGLEMPHLAGATGFTHANGLALLLNYDGDGRLTDMQTADGATAIQDLTLSYDAAANITAITDNLDSTRSQIFDYDAVGRLDYASGPYGDITYTYDLVGNRTERTINTGTVTLETYAYDAGTNRLASVTVGANVRSLGYTAAGSTDSDTRSGTALSFAYNHAGRLASVTAETGTLASREYKYDAFQHRVHETREDRIGQGIQGEAFSYVYDHAGHLLAEYAALGPMPMVRREYLWLGNTLVAMIDRTLIGTPLLAIHTDHLGRPQKLTDASQTVVWDGQFDPFGEEHSVTGTFDIPLRFPGQEWDGATGLSQNWHRDYDATLGRYFESDPIGLAGGTNLYSYAEAMPVGRIDATGLLANVGRTLGVLPVPIFIGPPAVIGFVTGIIVGGIISEMCVRDDPPPKKRDDCRFLREVYYDGPCKVCWYECPGYGAPVTFGQAVGKPCPGIAPNGLVDTSQIEPPCR
ncbi:MAG: RHS domain-containing protein [Actinobacteria bacterium]|nr:RHS domain-containing protein [Actinomycetota bacterium]